ncbi:anion exchange protein 4 [Lasiosphaeris hirsuta]|uniref:Anion exchange protein 4 n=1 Tax=Lasiosphaeris hirsuta TaxID=260670 RepID=A0AA40AR33_9PEZI|nr:anion exchange protein 4 [Lasiosphaeris hirsuta]
MASTNAAAATGSRDGLSIPTSLRAATASPRSGRLVRDWASSFIGARSRSRHDVGSGSDADAGPGVGIGSGFAPATATADADADAEEVVVPLRPKRTSSSWWKVHLFRGMVNDLRQRTPYYISDWTDAWNYRVVPATVYMYYANILPALAFSLDMITKTNMQYGVNEVLLASVLGAVVFSLAACQPLVIVGVTGPITVFNYTVYDIMTPTGTNYLAFMCWIGLWSLVFHWILAITNSCNWLRYVTRFPCDIFGFYVAFIYLQKGIQVLERLGDDEPFYLSIVVALLVFAVAYICGELGRSSLFKHPVRVFFKDYGTPLTVVFFTGFVHMGKLKGVPLENLPTSTAFLPTAARGWFIRFWEIRTADIFLAIPFAILLTVLFWFDHNVSSLIAQGTEFPLKKPAGFHWDLFLLGLTTGVGGLLGLPFPNGLIPQAPFHTESLCVIEIVADTDESGESKGHYEAKATHVVEQRVSNLAQGLLTLGTMSGPLLVVLHLIPQGVLAGLFFIMGVQALEANGITAKLVFLARDVALTPAGHPLKQVERRLAIWLFVAIELAGFGATFAITQTVAAVGFPVFILVLIPVRALLLPRWLSPQELAVLDAPTASPFTMESVGGQHDALASASDVSDAPEGGDSDRKGPLPSGGGLFWSTEASTAAQSMRRRRSAEELAELGESGSAARRRGSAAEKGDGESAVEMQQGVSRRGQASRASESR